MDSDYEERLARIAKAKEDSAMHTHLSRVQAPNYIHQTSGSPGWKVQGVTVSGKRPRNRGLKRRQRLMQKRLTQMDMLREVRMRAKEAAGA